VLTPRYKILGISLLFVFLLINTFFLVREDYWILLLSPAIFLIYLVFFKPGIAFLLLAFFAPFSIRLELEGFASTLFIPTEPLLILFVFLFLARIFISQDYEKKILKHPLSLIIMLNVLIMVISSFFSTMPLVSFKVLFARLWFVIPLYFYGILLFRDFRFIKSFIFLFSIALLLVVIETLIEQRAHYFTQVHSHVAPKPFFYDHTIYGAIIAMIIPLMIGFFIKYKLFALNIYWRFFTLALVIILITGIVFSFTRAAWVSLAVAAGFFLLLLLRIRFSYLMFTSFAVLIVVLFNWTRIVTVLDQKYGKSVSSSEFKEHIESISNISSDPSNTERINRWICAFRMFREKPILGWGPGTYMFQYAPFQLSKYRTSISTNRGDLGNAHSEFLGPLAESGIFGLVFFVLLFLIVLYKGMSLYYYGSSKQVRITAMLLLLSLITYFSHGIMNNFLHTDKASVPFWGFIGIIAALDIYHNNKSKENDA
jgi:putative inorganic carbon (hco3(-)) transporter